MAETVTSAGTSRPWQPSRPVAVLIGILSVWPIIYFFLFLAFMGYTFTQIDGGRHGGGLPDAFKYFFAAHILTMLLMFALLAIYIVHAFRTDRIPNDKRVLWVIVLFFGSVVAFPIYWYLYMWPKSGLQRNTPDRA